MRLSEIYVSIQGEGPRAGSPTRFIRFAGCNLKCPGWPCDTQHAIDPKIFEKEQYLLDPDELMEACTGYPTNLCLTGGEPFIQPKAELESFTEKALANGYTVEAFTNGTILYPDWALEKIHFIMDWKLPGSGEDPFNLIRITNAERLKATDYIKFVIADRNDYEIAKQIYEDMQERGTKAVWSFGAAWGYIESSELIEWTLADELPWQLNVQMHNFLWPPTERGR